LELLVRRYKTGQQKVIRARVVLLAEMGKNNREIADELEVSLDTARMATKMAGLAADFIG
jgi:orotate phosphoribosyltransferase-like protein